MLTVHTKADNISGTNEVPMPHDNYTAKGANVLARRIEFYWKERGHPTIRAEAYELPGMPGLFGVRSNLDWNGYPPRG